MKKLLLIKLAVVLSFFSLFFFLVITIVSLLGYSISAENQQRNLQSFRTDSYVTNNNFYAEDYRKLLNQYMFDYGYVSLERIVWYLQATNYNTLNIKQIPFIKWQDAYIKNANKELKQMIPTSEMCKQVNTSYYPPIIAPPTIETPNLNQEYYLIKLCDSDYVNNNNSVYTDSYVSLPYAFPLKQQDMGSVTSMVNEKRNVDLDLSQEQLESVNFHSGWDFSAKAETNIYSICDGTVTSIIFTQDENIPFNKQSEPKNRTGNMITIKCDNAEDEVTYAHLYPNSASSKIKENSKVKKGQFIAKVGTTGQSTGNHLHLGLKSNTGVRLDALYFIDFNFNNYTN